MDFSFSKDQDLLRKTVREFVEAEVAPMAAKWDEEDICPVDVFKKMGELGFAGVFVPSEYGGAGLGYTERAIILEEIARHSAGLAMFLMTHQLGVAAILVFGTEDQKKKYLPDLASGKKIAGLSVTEPTGGSDLTNHLTTGELVDGSWVLNGRKCFASNSHVAQVTVITARTGADEKGRPALTAFIVESGNPGLSLGRKENKLGLRVSVMGDLVLSNCRVTPENVLGGQGKGQRVALGIISEVGRAGMSAISLGLLRACLEESVKFAKERKLYGKPISSLQAIQFSIAETRVDYEAARMLTYNALSLKDAGKRCDVDLAMAKYFSSEAAIRAAKRNMDNMGGYGVLNEYPAGRLLRDGMATLPSAGTSNIMKIIVAAGTLA
ncbi:MAG: acyl-CoA dehydrogenase family protein [Desulfocucumaceae bacterium]